LRTFGAAAINAIGRKISMTLALEVETLNAC
jgi:hypothetical protein